MELAKILVPAFATLIGAAVVVFGWHKSHGGSPPNATRRTSAGTFALR